MNTNTKIAKNTFGKYVYSLAYEDTCFNSWKTTRNVPRNEDMRNRVKFYK